MALVGPIHPHKADYPEHLGSYISQIKEAIKLNKHHDKRRTLFVNYLRLAYNVDPVEVEIEEKIKVANIRGNIDALYKYLIFEFKTNLSAERPAAHIELQKYFLAQERPEEYIALLTDGINFEIYQFEYNVLKQISGFKLDDKEPISSYRALDDLIFSTQKTTPKASDITTRFGPSSAVFNKSRIFLEGLFDKVKNDTNVKLKYDEWNSLLSRVYGDRIGDVVLFLKHTYLTIFSRLLITNAIFPTKRKTRGLYKGLLTGQFFSRNNLPNVAEPDFFSWALDTIIEDDFIGLLSKIDKYLSVFNLSNVNEDILKGIYQELVDPSSRHSLGEYYTPDWIADLTLKQLDYKEGVVLDPACGSGTFLIAVVRRLRELGLNGTKLVDRSVNSIIGIDVHPLAVLMTKANILLSLSEEIKKIKKEVYLPVYMSDTLLTSEDKKTGSLTVSVSTDEEFRIPIETVQRKANLDPLLDDLTVACKGAAKDEKKKNAAFKGFEKKALSGFSDSEKFFWKQNFYLYAKLITEGRDTIWSFILKNAYRPAFIRQNKVDFVIGNPPWLAYRYIKDIEYKKKVKELTFYHELLKKDDVKLFTQMDTSTLFFVYSMAHFLKEDGTIAFVLPKSTILPSKQHHMFQLKGFTEIHDFSQVSPLFNVRSVLLISDPKRKKTKNINIYSYKGILPEKNIGLNAAIKFLKISEAKHSFLSVEPSNSFYYPHFQQGATIVPRCFWFIQKDKEASVHEDVPYLESSDEALKEAKDPWRMRIEGRVEASLIYETILANGLVPFGIIKHDNIFLPLIKQKYSIHMVNSEVLMEKGLQHSASWLDDIEEKWAANRQTNERDLLQRLNYHQKMTKQNINAPYIVLYNTSGTNLASALYFKGKKRTLEFKSKGFIADAKTYYYYPNTLEEGHYLVAILNSKIVNISIKAYQPQGLFGERDIHRRPFEVCKIPQFDPKNKIHRALAAQGKICHEEIEKYLPQLKGRIGLVRNQVKKILRNEIIKIDKNVEELLLEAGTNSSVLASVKQTIKNGDLFLDK